MSYLQHKLKIDNGGSPYNLNYLQWGSSSKTLICVHGLTRNARDFDYIAKALSNDYKVICIDMIGRGESDWVSPELYNYDIYVRDVIALIKELGLENSDWLGTSMGGIIGMIISSLKPGFIDKLILNDIGPIIPIDAMNKIGKYIKNTNSFNDLEEAEKHLRIRLSKFGIKKNSDWKYITKHSFTKNHQNKYILSYDQNIFTNFLKSTNNTNEDINLKQLWEKITYNKALVIRGKESHILNKQTLDYMLNTKKNITSVELEKIGHAPALMEENQIKIIKNFLL